jgi:hypothetical protein
MLQDGAHRARRHARVLRTAAHSLGALEPCCCPRLLHCRGLAGPSGRWGLRAGLAGGGGAHTCTRQRSSGAAGCVPRPRSRPPGRCRMGWRSDRRPPLPGSGEGMERCCSLRNMLLRSTARSASKRPGLRTRQTRTWWATGTPTPGRCCLRRSVALSWMCSKQSLTEDLNQSEAAPMKACAT